MYFMDNSILDVYGILHLKVQKSLRKCLERLWWTFG